MILKPGRIPWNKGKVGVQVSTRKGTKQPKPPGYVSPLIGRSNVALVGKPGPNRNKKRDPESPWGYDYSQWQTAVISRDKQTCQVCLAKEDLTAHHMKFREEFPELSLQEENGITLCRRCHTTLHHTIKKLYIEKLQKALQEAVLMLQSASTNIDKILEWNDLAKSSTIACTKEAIQALLSHIKDPYVKKVKPKISKKGWKRITNGIENTTISPVSFGVGQ
jgi:hypothetical protein